MISGGIATIYVSDMNRAVEFYTKTLGFNLIYRVEDFWAQIDAGKGLQLGLHPNSDNRPESNSNESITIGFEVTEPIEQVVESLRGRGANFVGELVTDEPVKIMNLRDPDNNHLYLFEMINPVLE